VFSGSVPSPIRRVHERRWPESDLIIVRLFFGP
jgi:hypothetical protein